MLDILRRIVQEVSSATDISDALKVVVARIREAMRTEVCSVYLYDPESQRYVLMATEGLKQEAVGRVSLSPSQGLVGLVGYGLGVIGTVFFIWGFSSNPTFKGFYIPWQIPLVSLVAVFLILALTGWLALRNVLKTEPASVFR